jgi:hypothetical protein
MGTKPDYLHTRSRVPFDAEPAITLRNGKDAAETASAAETPLAIKTSAYIGWDGTHQAFQDALVVIAATAVEVAGGETYTVAIEVDDDAAFGAPYKVGEVAIAKEGQYEVHMSARNIEANKPNARFVRANLTAAGGAPSIEYYAWVGKELM